MRVKEFSNGFSYDPIDAMNEFMSKVEVIDVKYNVCFNSQNMLYETYLVIYKEVKEDE